MPQNQSVAEPSTAMFNCSAIGHPRPTLSWQIFSNGVYTTIAQSNKYTVTNTPVGEQNQTSTLTIFNTSPQDSAQYKCNAMNILDSIESTMATLSVLGKSNTSTLYAVTCFTEYSGIPLIYQPPQDITVTESNTAAFNCSVSGQPPLGVMWFKQLPNGTLSPISVGGSFFISSSIVGSQNITSNLSISMVMSMDAGTYVCQANSKKLTYSSSTAVLNVLGEIILT